MTFSLQACPPEVGSGRPNRLARAALWGGLVVAILCGSLWQFYPLPDAQARLEHIPRSGPDFAGRDISLTDQERVVLGRVDLVHRKYRLGGRDFFLTVIDGTKDRHAVHDPRYCLQGAGWRLVAEQRLAIPGGTATWIKLAQTDDRVEAVFWFSDGMTRYSSFPRYWGQTVLRRLTLGRWGAEPVLVVLQSYEATPPDWSRLVRELIRRIPQL